MSVEQSERIIVYGAAMVHCYENMLSDAGRAELHRWETSEEFTRTDLWPGWEPCIGLSPCAPQPPQHGVDYETPEGKIAQVVRRYDLGLSRETYTRRTNSPRRLGSKKSRRPWHERLAWLVSVPSETSGTHTQSGLRCWYCGCCLADRASLPCDPSGVELRTRDHVVPIVRGGTDDSSNLVDACGGCNSAKAERSLEEFREYVREKSLGAIVALKAWPGMPAESREALRKLATHIHSSSVTFYGERLPA